MVRSCLPTCFLLLFATPAIAAPVATFELLPVSSSSVALGDSIQLRVKLTTTEAATDGFTFYLTEGTLSNFAGFAITAFDRSMSLFQDFTNEEADIISAAGGNNVLNPRNNEDLGAVVSGSAIAPGEFDVGIITLSTAALTNTGLYTINFGTPLEVTDGLGNPFPTVNTSGLQLNVTPAAVPEPSSMVLCGAVAFVAAYRARKRRRAASSAEAARSSSAVL